MPCVLVDDLDVECMTCDFCRLWPWRSPTCTRLFVHLSLQELAAAALAAALATAALATAALAYAALATAADATVAPVTASLATAGLLSPPLPCRYPRRCRQAVNHAVLL